MDEKEKLEKLNEYRNRFVRWQQLTLTQLSYTNNIILTLTTALLAFAITDTQFKLPTTCWLLVTFLIGYVFLLVSVLAGILLTLNRLNDFSKSKETIKYKRQRFETNHGIENHGQVKSLTTKIDDLMVETKKLGNQTWCLLRCQLWTFLLGSALLCTTILFEKIQNCT